MRIEESAMSSLELVAAVESMTPLQMHRAHRWQTPFVAAALAQNCNNAFNDFSRAGDKCMALVKRQQEEYWTRRADKRCGPIDFTHGSPWARLIQGTSVPEHGCGCPTGAVGWPDNWKTGRGGGSGYSSFVNIATVDDAPHDVILVRAPERAP